MYNNLFEKSNSKKIKLPELIYQAVSLVSWIFNQEKIDTAKDVYHNVYQSFA